jgi:hypothetical protein
LAKCALLAAWTTCPRGAELSASRLGLAYSPASDFSDDQVQSMKSMRLGALSLSLASIASLGAERAAQADTVVQIPVDSVLDGRPVSTLTGGTIVPWTVGDGVDGNGQADGFVTLAVEMKLGQTGNALPNDGVFPAMNGIPEVDLHFSNDNPATSPQAHSLHAGAVASMQFAVPAATYSKIFLIMTDSENGEPNMTVTMTYSDSTTSTIGPFMLGDYDQGLPGNTAQVSYFSLISMHKWSSTDQQGDNPQHMITGVTVAPTPTKTLTGIEIAKPNDGHYVLFWGAVGIATSAVSPIDAGGLGSDGDAGNADSSVEPTEASTGASSGTANGSGSTSGAGASSGGVTSGEPNGSGTTSGSTPSGGSSTGTGGGSSGSSGAGGEAASGSTTGTSGSGSNAGPSSKSSSGGCSVRGGHEPARGVGWNMAVLLALAGLGWRRRARSRGDRN